MVLLRFEWHNPVSWKLKLPPPLGGVVVQEILKLSWTEKITNKEVLQRMDKKRTLISILRARKLRYFGHLIRLSNLYKTLLEAENCWNIAGTRGRECQTLD